MAKILVGTMPFAGHANPFMPIVRELAGRGHEVRWYTGSHLRGKVEAAGAAFEPMRLAPDVEDHLDLFPEMAGMAPLANLKYSIKHLFADSARGQIGDYRRILRSWPADVCLTDGSVIGPAWLHELGGAPPWAAYNPFPVTLSSRDTAPFGVGLAPSASALGRVRNAGLGLLFTEVVFRDVVAYVDGMRRSLGLRPKRQFIFDALLSPYLELQGTVPSFEYPRSDLPPQVHFIGPSVPAPAADFVPPSWWGDLDSDKPVVLVTQGTVATQADQLIAPTIRALAGEDVLVVATTGGRAAEALGLDPLPANARVESFIPFANLLPRVDVLVTNGGYGGVQFGLAHGVPIVAAGTTEDKPEVTARVAWAGVGLNLKSDSPGEDRIRDAVRQVLADGRYRARSRAMAAEIARHDPPREAADLLEQLAETRQPVLNGQRWRARAAQPADRLNLAWGQGGVAL